MLKVIETPTETELGTDAVLNNIAASTRLIVEDSAYSWDQVMGIGAGIPGFMDFEEGFMHLLSEFAINECADQENSRREAWKDGIY